MPNIFVDIGKGLEVGAKDFDEFLSKLKTDVGQTFSPRSLLALAVLLASVEPVVVSCAEAAAAGGLNIPLDIESAELIINALPAIKADFENLAIRPAKG